MTYYLPRGEPATTRATTYHRRVFSFPFPLGGTSVNGRPGGPSLGSAVDEQQGVTEGETKQEEEVISSPPAS